MRLATVIWVGALLLAPVPSTADESTARLVERGRRLYEEGLGGDGRAVVGVTAGAVELTGARAACAQCHRRSGSGNFEGGNRVPAITAPALFAPPDLATTYQPRLAAGNRHVPFRELRRPPYDGSTLARALRDGIDPAGERLQPLMPRYALSAPDMESLEAYLRQLSAAPSPGVDGRRVFLTTVHTPGATAETRRVAVQVLEACLAERFPESSPGGLHTDLRLLALAGPAETWANQLAAAERAQPSYAYLAGAGGADWAPVQHFCELSAMPCLFPSVDTPGQRKPTPHAFYFSGGTALEGEVMARWLSEWRDKSRGGAQVRLVVVRRADDDAARAGIDALRSNLDATWPLEERLLDAPAVASPGDKTRRAETNALSGLGGNGVVVLFLRNDTLRQLATAFPAGLPAAVVLASGWLAGEFLLDAPSAWRSSLHFTWALDPPLRLERRMSVNLRPWLAGKGITVAKAEERIAGDALTACNVFVESVARQRGALTRAKLIEQVENYPAAMGNAMAPQAYHRFSLGPGQRFSSKGAFVVRFAPPELARLEPEGDWRVP